MKIATICVVSLAALPLSGVEPGSDPVVCCNEARTFLNGMRQTDQRMPKKNLFVDDAVIDRLQDVRRTLHQPKKHGAVIREDRPWEGTIQTRTGPSWNPEKKLWMLWYFASGGTGYATSKDGIHWEKPVLGLREYKGSKENNLVSETIWYPLYDPKDPDPNRRYKGVTPRLKVGASGGGFAPAVSPDGLNWKILENSFVLSQDEANLFHDADRNQYVFTVKHPGPYGRSVYLTLSRDFEHWTDPRDCLIFHADKRDQDLGRKWIEQRFSETTLQHPEYNIPSEYNVQVYNMALFRYGDLYLGLPAMYHQTGRVSKDWEGFDKYDLVEEIRKAVRLYGDWTGFHHLQLISSRNLVDWQRVGGRQPFIDASPANSGAYDLQTIMPAPPVVRGDEIWFYYTGIRNYAYVTSGRPDAGGICLAKLRLDGFVSLDAGDAGGTVLTKPIVVDGDNLRINLDASKGDVRAEILDAAGNRALPGYTMKESVAARGDHVDAELRWRTARISALKGRTVRLRFALRNASLYAFRF
ncbi:MAG: hypothetical protein ACKV22_20635 [Bryobacteraceae bacterium]